MSAVLRLLAVVTISLLVGACTHMYSHEYQVDPSEPLTQDELRQVFVSFKSFLVAKGMRELPPAKAGNVDDAAFQFGSGKSGLLREPFEEYLRLSYTPESGFHLAVVRVISHPVDFSEQYLAEFKAKTEQFIHEATNKNVQLHVIQRQP